MTFAPAMSLWCCRDPPFILNPLHRPMLHSHVLETHPASKAGKSVLSSLAIQPKSLVLPKKPLPTCPHSWREPTTWALIWSGWCSAVVCKVPHHVLSRAEEGRPGQAPNQASQAFRSNHTRTQNQASIQALPQVDHCMAKGPLGPVLVWHVCRIPPLCMRWKNR